MDWSHAPLHRTSLPGWYFITAGTYAKQHLLADERRREALIALMQSTALELELKLDAWVVLSNHYHLIVRAHNGSIPAFIRKVHSISARDWNSCDAAAGRKVWFQYWDKYLTLENAYLARLNYIHQNPVHHGIVRRAENYRWSSLAWFESTVDMALAKAVRQFKIDRLRVPDDF